MRFLTFFLCTFFIWNLAFSDSKIPSSSQKKSKKIQTEAGLNIPSWGVAIDAIYEPKLDDLIPGYKILNVILSNRGAAMIYLDPMKDRWQIRDHLGRSHTAINHVRLINEATWNELPAGLKEKLEYPHAVRVAHSTKIDLFFPKTIELSNMREIVWKSSHFQKEFSILTNLQEPEDNSKEEKLPSLSETEKQSMEKYEGLLKAKEEIKKREEEKNRQDSIPVK